MKLYYTSSVCSLAVRIIINELKIVCTYEAVDLKTKITASGKDFLAINRKGSVPALELPNKEILTENAVILQYLCDSYSAYELLPANPSMQRYRVLEWLNFISTDLHRYCAPLFWSRFTDEIKTQVFQPILKNKLTMLNQHLQSNTYLMGSHFTVADSYFFVILIWLAKLQFNTKEWPSLSMYFNNMKKRDSVYQSLLEEGLENYHLANKEDGEYENYTN